MVEALNDDDFARDGQVTTEVGEALNVSVMSPCGDLLVAVVVSGRGLVWELKALIERSVRGQHMKAASMVLMLGTQVLEDAASIHEAGITHGSELTIAPKYKLLVRTSQGNIDLLSQEGMCEATILAGPNDVFEAVFSPDNTLIATMDAVSVKLWRVCAGECLFVFTGHGPLISVAFSPTGTMLMIVAQTNEAKLWCTNSGECISALQVSRLGRIITAFTTDAALVLHMYDGRIALWNMRTASRVWEYPLNCQLYGPCSAGFSSCGDWFFTISDTGKVPTNGVDVWRVSGCARYRHIHGPASAGKIKAASFSPDGWRMVTITIRNVITVWGLGSDWAGSTFCPQGRLSCCGFLPDGVQVLTIAGSEVSLWSVDGKVPERTSVKKDLFAVPAGFRPQRLMTKPYFTWDGKYMFINNGGGLEMWNVGSMARSCRLSDQDLEVLALSN